MTTADILKTLDEDWRKTMLAMYNSGASDREVMRELNITPAKWRRLEDDVLESDFAEIAEYGRMLSAAWWEEQGRINLKNKDFNTGLWQVNVKHRLGWGSDKPSESAELANVDTEEMNRRIRQLLEKHQGGPAKTTL